MGDVTYLHKTKYNLQIIDFDIIEARNIRIIFATIGIEQDIKNKTNKENEKD